MPIPLVVGPNMNIHEDQHHHCCYSAICASILLCRLAGPVQIAQLLCLILLQVLNSYPVGVE